MLIVTTDHIPGRTHQVIGLVRGSTIQTRNIGKDFAQSLKTIVGGELKFYTEMMDSARDLATHRMEDEAARLDADAIVCVRYATSAIMQGAAEVMVYGTAVKFD